MKTMTGLFAVLFVMIMVSCQPSEDRPGVQGCEGTWFDSLERYGDGICDEEFNCTELDWDDGDCFYCGNEVCDGEESCKTCPADCDVCPMCTDDSASDCCPPGEIKDCNWHCVSESYLGGWCNDGVLQTANLRCEKYNWDEEACCPLDEVKDCKGDCYPERFLGDDICDDLWSGGANFDCEEFEWDKGDCCPKNQLKDCNGQCVPQEWFGDGICDEALTPHTPNFNCEKHYWDLGDCVRCGDGVCAGYEYKENTSTCAEDCPAKCGDHTFDWTETCETCPADCPTSIKCPDAQVIDCYFQCQPKTLLGNGKCNTATNFQAPNLNCSWNNWDNGDCDLCGNEICNAGENCETCPEDCPVCPL